MTKSAVRGSHKTVYSCSLPGCLPEDVLDQMNAHFGEQLLKGLLKLIESKPIGRFRSDSSGSSGLSDHDYPTVQTTIDLSRLLDD